ncbi:MAG: RNA-binding protein [Parasphingorhabdus sp.]|jgi:RNA-binding protein
MSKLSSKQISYLRGLAHHRKVIISVGNAGITKGVVSELDDALKIHELVKIKITGEDKQERYTSLERLCSATDSVLVQLIGKTGIAYRAAKKPIIKIP